MLNADETWGSFRSYKGFHQMYIKFMKRTRLTCRVFKKLHMNKQNKKTKETPIETIETVVEEDQIETISTLRREPRQVYSLKLKCKIQIQNWALEIIGLIDTECSNTILDKKLVPPQYHKPIPLPAQFSAEQMDGQLFTYTHKLEKCKMSFYLPNNTLTNYITIDNEISLRDLQLRQVQFIIGLNLLFTVFRGCIITTTGISFLSYPLLSFTSEFAAKRGGIPPPPSSSSPCCNSCRAPTVENLENFQDSSFYELL